MLKSGACFVNRASWQEKNPVKFQVQTNDSNT